MPEPKGKGSRRIKDRLSQWALPNPGAFPDPHSNWYRLPNDWFDRLRWLRTTNNRHRCVGAIKVMEYLLKHTWGWQNFDGAVTLSLDEFERGRLGRNGEAIDLGTRTSRHTIIDALDLLVEAGWVERVSDEHRRNNNFPYSYRPHLTGKTETRMHGVAFAGFPWPKQNFFAMPWIWTDLMTNTNSEILIVCVEYLVRHQWGFASDERRKPRPVLLTADEFAYGRLNGGGERYDSGTGGITPLNGGAGKGA